MALRFFRAGAVSLLLAMAAGAHAAPAVPQTPDQWRQAATTDIEAAYRITLENHPGTYDPVNPAFMPKLARARAGGLALAAQVRDSSGYLAALQRFNTLIHDGHAGVAVQRDVVKVELRWPGFVAVWRGDGMLVYASEAGGPPAGARIDACDGKSMSELAESNVFAFDNRSDERGNWWVYARELFIDRGNPFITRPAQCSFTLNGKQTTQTLDWRPFSEQAMQWRVASYNGVTLPVGLTEPRAKLFWVAMPTFQPDEGQRAVYRAMTAEVKQHRQRYLDADAVVIDLRDNQGGSSIWSRDFAQALWGEERVNRLRKEYSARQQVWWRASADNTAYLRHMADVLRDEKQQAYAAETDQVADGMQAALQRGDKFFVPKDEASAAVESGEHPADPPAFTKPVYVVVPGQCASACLDALDYFTLFPNTKLIGAPSSADSSYMEVRTQPLESGLARVIIPNKMYVGRRRAAGQFYTPAIYVNDLEWSQRTFLKTVEADLARSRR
jgi:hypothetical protein